jgi:hypothetical protein
LSLWSLLLRLAPATYLGHGFLKLRNGLEDLSVEEVMEQFDATREQIAAVLDFVARSLDAPEPEPPAFVDARSLRSRYAAGPCRSVDRSHGHYRSGEGMGQIEQRRFAGRRGRHSG